MLGLAVVQEAYLALCLASWSRQLWRSPSKAARSWARPQRWQNRSSWPLRVKLATLMCTCTLLRIGAATGVSELLDRGCTLQMWLRWW